VKKWGGMKHGGGEEEADGADADVYGLYHSAENLGVQCDVIFHGRFQDELDG